MALPQVRRLHCSLSLSSDDAMENPSTPPESRTSASEIIPTVHGCIVRHSARGDGSAPSTPTGRSGGMSRVDRSQKTTPENVEAAGERSATALNLKRQEFKAKAQALAEERQECNRQLREIKLQAEDWRRRRDALRQDMRQTLGMEPSSPAAKESGKKRPASPLHRDERRSWIPPEEVQRLFGDDLCVICLEPLSCQAQVLALCGHVFHKSCLEFGVSSGSCPSCRKPMDRIAPERLLAVSILVMKVGLMLPSVCGNIREANLATLLAKVNREAQKMGTQQASPQELRAALEALEKKGDISFDGAVASFF